mgnify:CR=1 FL=1
MATKQESWLCSRTCQPVAQVQLHAALTQLYYRQTITSSVSLAGLLLLAGQLLPLT